jgi:hypothetical protein
MGAQFNNGLGSFLSTSNGTVYSQTDAKTNASLIDFALLLTEVLLQINLQSSYCSTI